MLVSAGSIGGSSIARREGDIRLRGGVVVSVVGEDLWVEQAVAEIAMGLVVGDGALLGVAGDGGVVLALHGAEQWHRRWRARRGGSSRFFEAADGAGLRPHCSHSRCRWADRHTQRGEGRARTRIHTQAHGLTPCIASPQHATIILSTMLFASRRTGPLEKRLASPASHVQLPAPATHSGWLPSRLKTSMAVKLTPQPHARLRRPIALSTASCYVPWLSLAFKLCWRAPLRPSHASLPSDAT